MEATLAVPAAAVSNATSSTPKHRARTIGRIMSGVVNAFMLFDSVIKLAEIDEVREGFVQFGFAAEHAPLIGLIGLVAIVTYAFPRTAVLGAILLSGFLGGAIVSHLRVGSPLFSHTLFPIYVGVIAWGGLYLRDERVRALIPLRR